jgi:hypothetical protein
MHYGPGCGVYGPQCKVWLCTMGQSAEFGYALLSTVRSLVIHYGPDCGVCLCTVGQSTEFGYAQWTRVQIWFCTLGQSVEFGYTLWARVQSLVVHYGHEYRVWLCTMGQSAEFGYAPWANAQIHWLQRIITSTCFKIWPHPLKGFLNVYVLINFTTHFLQLRKIFICSVT